MAFLPALHRSHRARACLNVNRTDFSRNALLMYTTQPFLTSNKHLPHQNRWQVREITRLLGLFEYNVDVIDYNDSHYRVRKDYNVVLEIHPGLTPTADRCAAPTAKRIAYMTGSDHEFSNRAENDRLEHLYERRGVRLKARRPVAPLPFHPVYLPPMTRST